MQFRINDKPFEQNLQKILFYIKEYGMSQLGDRINLNDDDNYQHFTRKCHEGFYLAQDMIIEELLNINKDKHELEDELIKLRSERNNKDAKHVELQIQLCNSKEFIIRRCADSMAWQMIGWQKWVARRLCLEDDPICIRSSNIIAGIDFIKSYKQNEPDSFALLTDLTSFVHIGDVFIVKIKDRKREMFFGELKSGKANAVIVNFLESLVDDEYKEKFHSFYNDYGPKYYEQMLRVMKQKISMQKTLNILKDEEGEDAKGDYVKIIESNTETTYFVENICTSFEKLKTKTYAIGEMDNCLYYGIYNIENKHTHHIFKEWMKAIQANGPIFNFFNNCKTLATIPIFLFPFSNSDLLDLVMGRKILLMCLDLDKFAELGRQVGVQLEWASKKELAHIKKSVEPFKHNGRGYVHVVNNSRIVLTGGFFGRIFFEMTTPASAINILKSYAKKETEESSSERCQV